MGEQHEQPQNEEILQYHRAAGLALTPVMQQLGYATEVEVDISMKSQLIDTLQAILQHRLGELPAPIDERLRACTLAQLNDLVNPALDATTWAEFLAVLPAPTA